jgi:hypothetical protein
MAMHPLQVEEANLTGTGREPVAINLVKPYS